MKKIGATALVVLVLILATTVPSDAWGRGGHSRGHSGHHGHHGRCCWWGPGAIIGGLALGAALALPFYAYAYPPYPVYSPPVAAPAPVVYQQAPAPQPLVQREVVHPHGKYVLHGDGVSQAWQWVWVPAPSTAPPAPQ